MKIEDCEVGMKLECLEENYPNGFHKGDILTVKEIINKAVRFEESRYTWNIYNFKPANKFEVGDEVIYNCPNGIKYDSVIFGIKDRQYAIKYTHKTIEHYDVVKERQLSPLKKKDELEVGDKFRNKFYEFRIIFVAYDDFYNKKKYICKINDTGSKGLIQTMFPEDIKEIIYE